MKIKCLRYQAIGRHLSFCTLILLLSLSVSGPIKAQDSLAVIQGSSSNNSWLEFSDASHALYHHLAGQAYRFLDQRVHAVAGIHSLPRWKARQQRLRQTLRDVFGPFPQKTPLHARITKTVDKDGYRVENIVYQSQPGFYVTSSLFIPDGIAKPAPAILFTSGHTPQSYRYPAYQQVILNLVRKGFVVFAIDPVGQGERLQYYNPKTGRSKVGPPTHQHSYAGAQVFITGSSLAQYETWDGIRAVDYLLSRKKLVDPDRIGIAGQSGGGTQCAYIAAFDKRIYAASPSSYITNFTRLLQSIGPQDAEQDPPGFIARGLDHADFLEVRAPKPTLILTTTRDFFSIQGAREAAQEVSRIYKAYGIPGRIGMVEDDAIHSYTKKNRAAMYGFFQKYLDNPGSSKDEEVELLENHELQVTRTGHVANSLGGETVFSLNRTKAKSEEKALQAAREDLSRHLPKAIKAAKRLSGYRSPDSVSAPVFAGRFQKDGYAIEKYFVMGEGGSYPIPYLLFVPDKPNGKALIYLNPAGKAARLRQEEWLGRQGVTVLAPDLLGVGEMGRGTFSKSHTKGMSFSNMHYSNWFASILIGRSIVGIQAGDVVRLVRLLQKRNNIKDVYGLARQQLGPVLLHAAAFDSSLARIALIKPYSSYRSIVENRFYKPAYIPSTVAGALTAYDLPDLAASLAPRKLLMADMRDGTGAPADSETFNADTAVIKAAYQQEHGSKQLKFISGPSAKFVQGLVANWIR